MKKVIFLAFMVFLLGSAIQTYAESSEDKYSLENACLLSGGSHLGHIIGLENDSRFRDILTDSNYSIESFVHIADAKLWYNNNLYFVVNDIGNTGEQEFSELFIVNCSPDSGQTVHFPVHRKESTIQYSPAVSSVTESVIILEDWQNMAGKSYHVSMIFDRKMSTFYHIRNEVLLKNNAIKAYVRGNQFYWDVKSYNNGVVRLEVRLSDKKKRNFVIKLK